MCWMLPPILVASVLSRTFQFRIAAYLSLLAGLRMGWLTLTIVWSRLTSSVAVTMTTAKTPDNKPMHIHASRWSVL